jgi:prophage regulatory protein
MDNLLRPATLAKKLDIGISTLYDKMKNDPEFPPKIKLGKGNAVAFRESDVEAWLEANTEEKEAV